MLRGALWVLKVQLALCKLLFTGVCRACMVRAVSMKLRCIFLLGCIPLRGIQIDNLALTRR